MPILVPVDHDPWAGQSQGSTSQGSTQLGMVPNSNLLQNASNTNTSTRYTTIPIDHDPFANLPQGPTTLSSGPPVHYGLSDILPIVREKAANMGYGNFLQQMLGDYAKEKIDGIKSAVTAPGDALAGRLDPLSEEGLNRVQGLAGLMAGGSVVPKPVGAVGIFGGKLARTADLEALKSAQSLAKKGASNDVIFGNTGWFKGADGQWRFEIPDTAARMTGEIDAPVNEVMQHNALFKAYPQLKNISVDKDPSVRVLNGDNSESAVYYPQQERILVKNNVKPEILLHELQHGVQDIEGFQNGGSPTEFYKYKKDPNSPIVNLPAKSGEIPINPISNTFEAYTRLAGETEARNVETRYKTLGAYAQHPSLTEDTPRNLQILKYQGENGNEFSLPAANKPSTPSVKTVNAGETLGDVKPSKSINKISAAIKNNAVPQVEGENIAFVDVNKINDLWKQDPDFFIASGGDNQRLQRAMDFISNYDGKVAFNPPRLGVGSNHLGFDDGRHRFAAMRDLGFKEAPVAMDAISMKNAADQGLIVNTPKKQSKGNKSGLKLEELK